MTSQTEREACNHNDPDPSLNWQPDKGPWVFGIDPDGRTFLESAHFHHDVRLYIDGDFACQNCKRLYGEDLAAQLNSAQARASLQGGGNEKGA